MHDLNRNLFYKTSFDIQAKNDEDALWCLILSIRYWVLGKCKGERIVFPEDLAEWGMFKGGGRLVSGDNEKSFVLESESFWHKEDTSFWACSVTEKVKKSGHATREWVTEIGFSFQEKDSGTVYLVLSYADLPGYLGKLQPMPEPSIPRIVQNIISNNNVNASVLGIDLNEVYEPICLRAGDFPAFWEIVDNPEREIPVIYVSPRFESGKPKWLINPRKIADILGPSALVYYSDDQGYCAEMSYCIPSSDLRCAGGTVRVYAVKPNFNNTKDYVRHRFFSPAVIDELGEKKILLMFRRVFAQDVYFYEDMVRNETVRRMRRQEVLEKDYQSKIDAAEEEGVNLAGTIEEELLAYRKENDRLQGENSSLRSDVHSLNAQIENYERAFNATTKPNREITIGKWPLSTTELMNLMGVVFSDRLDFTDRAIRSFDECPTNSDVLWNGMIDLCTIAYDLYVSNESADITKEFNGRSTFTLARGAGSMTRKNAKLMENYRDEYQGRELNVETHIKKGNKEKDGNFLRIYYGFDRETNKIIVSYIGGHLDNYSTRYLS